MPQATASTPRDLPPVVLFTPTGRDQPLIERVLQREGISCAGCGSAEELLERVEAGVGPVIVTEEALDDQAMARLGGLIDHQPNWSELPVITLARASGRGDARVRELARRSGVRWLRRPIDGHTLLEMVRVAVEARRRQTQVGELLHRQEQLNQSLRRRAGQLREMTVELIDAEDRERKRIAELLHDDLQQMLVGANLHLSVALNQAGPRNQSLRQPLERVKGLIADAQQACRSLSHELFPRTLSEDDLSGVFGWVAEHARQTHGLHVRINTADGLNKVDPAVVRFIYRAAREVLCNTAKHAETDTVRIDARREGNRLELVVSDDGRGFDPAILDRGVKGGVGLAAIRERAESLGGELRIDSEPGRGTRLTFRVPVTPVSPPDPTLFETEPAS